MIVDQEVTMLKRLLSIYQRHDGTIRNPGFWIVSNYHFGVWGKKLPQPARTIASAVYGIGLTLTEFILHSSLYCETTIGMDLHLIHATGIRISPKAVIGARVGIMHNVIIGTSPDREGTPTIGDDVLIGAGAKILGPVTIGNRARVAASSLVISDVPEGMTAVGVPARIIHYTGRPSVPQLQTTDTPAIATWKE